MKKKWNFIKEYKWYIVFLVVCLAVNIGLAVLSAKQENSTHSTQSYKQLTSMMRAQERKLNEMSARLKSQSSTTTNTIHREVIVKTVYSPATGKIIEKTVTHAGDDIAATQTVAVESYQHTVQYSTETVYTVATSTQFMAATDTVAVAPAPREADEHPIGLNAVFDGSHIKPTVSYSDNIFDLGVIRAGPAVNAGQDLIGIGASLDISKLPRIHAGYKCNYRISDCGVFYGLGIKAGF